MNFFSTKITDKNINDLVRQYVESKNNLPRDLKNIKIGSWDIKAVTFMPKLFLNYKTFNEDLSNWNVSNVTNMSEMFSGCSAFNSTLNWDVSSVKDMTSMFSGCTAFEGMGLVGWSVFNVSSMSSMFEGCSAFNADLSPWSVDRALFMSNMFKGCRAFEGIGLDRWDVSSVSNMSHMFEGCSVFNANLSRWDVGSVRDMSGIFLGCSAFNADVSGWNISRALFTTDMFLGSGVSVNHQPHVPGKVDAQHVHKVAANVDFEKLNNFLKDKTGKTMPDNLNFPNYINTSMLELINSTESAVDKKNQTADLANLMTNRLNALNYTYLSPVARENIYYSLEYVKQQPLLLFKTSFINNFLADCIGAYNNEITCSGGAVERMGLYLDNAARFVLSAGVENEDCDMIIGIISKTPKILIPSFILDWYKMHKKDTPTEFPIDTPESDKIASLKTFLLTKLPDETALIDEFIESYAVQGIGLDSDSFTYGGRKSRKSKSRKSIKSKRKSNKSKRK